MVSIIGLDDEKVEQICKEMAVHGVVCAANYNSPGQVVISGEKTVLERRLSWQKNAGQGWSCLSRWMGRSTPI